MNEVLRDFLRELSQLFTNLDLQANFWLAGSYARNEQKAKILHGKIYSYSDMELLIVTRRPIYTKLKLARIRRDIDLLISRYFHSEKSLDFGYWIVTLRYLEKRPCVFFFDTLGADASLVKNIKVMDNGINKYFFRDLREILIHRLANQFLNKYRLYKSNYDYQNEYSVVTRNILDLLTVYFYSEGLFSYTYKERCDNLTGQHQVFFGQDAIGIFKFCLETKLESNFDEVNKIYSIDYLENYFYSMCEKLDRHLETRQESMYGERSYNYAGQRLLYYKLMYFLRNPSLHTAKIILKRKKELFNSLVVFLKNDNLKSESADEFPSIQSLKEILHANYPYIWYVTK